MEYENTFVREVKEKNITDPSDILNWYRNLYHTEDNHTEHGIVAYAIDDFFADVVPKSEYDMLQDLLDAANAGQKTLQEHIANVRAEGERLQRILDSYALQYGTVTDQQRVIDKEKSEVAREIFEEIDKELDDVRIEYRDHMNIDGVLYTNGARSIIAELKKKYIGE